MKASDGLQPEPDDFADQLPDSKGADRLAELLRKGALANNLTFVWLCALLMPVLALPAAAFLPMPAWKWLLLVILCPFLGQLVLRLGYNSYYDYASGLFHPQALLAPRTTALVKYLGLVLRYGLYLSIAAIVVTGSHLLLRSVDAKFTLDPGLRAWELLPWLGGALLMSSYIVFSSVCHSWPAWKELDSMDIDYPPSVPMINL